MFSFTGSVCTFQFFPSCHLHPCRHKYSPAFCNIRQIFRVSYSRAIFLFLLPANSTAAVLLIEVLFVAWKDSSRELNHLARFAGLSMALELPGEHCCVLRMYVVLPAAFLVWRSAPPICQVIPHLSNTC